MKTSRLSRRLESIIKFLVQIFPLILVFTQFIFYINFFSFDLSLSLPNSGSEFITPNWNNVGIKQFLSGCFSDLLYSFDEFIWLDSFNFYSFADTIFDYFGITNNDNMSVFYFIFCYIGYLIFVEFLWLIKDILLACPRIVSKFINKLTGGDLD